MHSKTSKHFTSPFHNVRSFILTSYCFSFCSNSLVSVCRSSTSSSSCFFLSSFSSFSLSSMKSPINFLCFSTNFFCDRTCATTIKIFSISQSLNLESFQAKKNHSEQNELCNFDYPEICPEKRTAKLRVKSIKERLR